MRDSSSLGREWVKSCLKKTQTKLRFQTVCYSMCLPLCFISFFVVSNNTVQVIFWLQIRSVILLASFFFLIRVITWFKNKKAKHIASKSPHKQFSSKWWDLIELPFLRHVDIFPLIFEEMISHPVLESIRQKKMSMRVWEMSLFPIGDKCCWEWEEERKFTIKFVLFKIQNSCFRG